MSVLTVEAEKNVPPNGYEKVIDTNLEAIERNDH